MDKIWVVYWADADDIFDDRWLFKGSLADCAKYVDDNYGMCIMLAD